MNFTRTINIGVNIVAVASAYDLKIEAGIDPSAHEATIQVPVPPDGGKWTEYFIRALLDDVYMDPKSWPFTTPYDEMGDYLAKFVVDEISVLRAASLVKNSLDHEVFVWVVITEDLV